MLGRGVYFYNNDATGRHYAFTWAKHLISKHALTGVQPCVLLLSFACDEACVLYWSEREELDFLGWMNSNKPGGMIERCDQNVLRLRFISATIRVHPDFAYSDG